jgi:hypothetical protein
VRLNAIAESLVFMVAPEVVRGMTRVIQRPWY